MKALGKGGMVRPIVGADHGNVSSADPGGDPVVAEPHERHQQRQDESQGHGRQRQGNGALQAALDEWPERGQGQIPVDVHKLLRYPSG